MEVKRETWGSKREYILSTVGCCVGLGNIWRFPYVCITNGGGAFLLPFLLSLVFCGMPVFLLETVLGQFLGKGSWHSWSYCPLLKGLGLSMNILNGTFCFYYSIIIAWTLLYIFHSFKSPLPWSQCDQWWNSPYCVQSYDLKDANGTTLPAANASIMASMAPMAAPGNESLILSSGGLWLRPNETTSPSEEFWLNNILQLSSGIGDLGGIPLASGIALVIANLAVLLGVIKGIKSSGKVVYFTATLPYLLLTVMLILGCTLPGAADGILYYITPDFRKLLTYKPWSAAAIQCFYSLVAGWGPLITMASYNKFHNNVMRDSIMLTMVCEGTSLYGGFALFSILGHMAHKAGKDVSEYAKSGPGLVFVVYPEAISHLPLPQLWGVLFFLMLFTLGLDSMFSSVETIITVLADLYPKVVNRWRPAITTAAMAMFTVVGLLFACRGGMYWFQMVDWYIAAFAVLLQASIECISIAWIYGMDRFSDDIRLMIGRKPYIFFVVCWKYVTPAILLVLWAITLATYVPPVYQGYVFPPICQLFGWLFAVAPFMAVVIFAVRDVYSHSGSLKQRLRKATTPTPEWGPALPELREQYRYDKLATGEHNANGNGISLDSKV